MYALIAAKRLNRRELCALLPAVVHSIIIIIIIILLLFFYPRKNEGGKKIRKVERGLKWKTSPGGPQRENRRAAIRR